MGPQDLQDFSGREKSMELRKENAGADLHAGGWRRGCGLFKRNPLCQQDRNLCRRQVIKNQHVKRSFLPNSEIIFSSKSSLFAFISNFIPRHPVTYLFKVINPTAVIMFSTFEIPVTFAVHYEV